MQYDRTPVLLYDIQEVLVVLVSMHPEYVCLNDL